MLEGAAVQAELTEDAGLVFSSSRTGADALPPCGRGDDTMIPISRPMMPVRAAVIHANCLMI